MQFVVMRPFLGFLVALPLLMGCAGKVVEDQPPEAHIQVIASNELNPDANGRPSPIVLRVYSLKSAEAFNNARFFELYENGDDILGVDLLAQFEFEIFPGQTSDLENVTLDLDTSYIGFLAAYRDLDKAVWRASIPVTQNETSEINTRLGQLSIAVSKQQAR